MKLHQLKSHINLLKSIKSMFEALKFGAVRDIHINQLKLQQSDTSFRAINMLIDSLSKQKTQYNNTNKRVLIIIGSNKSMEGRLRQNIWEFIQKENHLLKNANKHLVFGASLYDLIHTECEHQMHLINSVEDLKDSFDHYIWVYPMLQKHEVHIDTLEFTRIDIKSNTWLYDNMISNTDLNNLLIKNITYNLLIKAFTAESYSRFMYTQNAIKSVDNMIHSNQKYYLQSMQNLSDQSLQDTND